MNLYFVILATIESDDNDGSIRFGLLKNDGQMCTQFPFTSPLPREYDLGTILLF